ncbi:MAG: hypothetical protein IPJ57_20970 [Gemmatimonadetes bacterium]|nr:hypothetical protein [Gemmatimonadota bacterium]
MKFPKKTDVGRYGDMSPHEHLRVSLDGDHDVMVSVWDDCSGASIEFCTAGLGGGKSPRTRDALIALMCAIEDDNEKDPSRDWLARRMGRFSGHNNQSADNETADGELDAI